MDFPEDRKKPGPKPGFKNANKDVRAPVGIEQDVNKLSQSEKVRLATGKQARLDASFYNRLPEYQGKTLFWENDQDGTVEKWLSLGAELVLRRSASGKIYKGFNDNRGVSEWECRPVGSDGRGGTLMAYLLVMTDEDYHALRIAPHDQRNQDVLDALGLGKANVDERVMPQVKGLKTYAPNLPTGGRGFEQEHDA